MPENIPLIPVTVERIEPPMPELPKEIMAAWSPVRERWDSAFVQGDWTIEKLVKQSDDHLHFHILRLRLPAAGETREQRILRKLRERLKTFSPGDFDAVDVQYVLDQLEAEEKDGAK